ncbi:MAG: hypothetical protein KDA55_21255, partial [Planctomycetales bacterium]|nr:hypothetical protein [Planctomycetales bacterium]
MAETTAESTPAEGHGSAKSRKPLPQAQPLKRPGNDPRWAVSTDAAASPAASHSIAAKAAPQPQNPSGSPAIARPVAAPIQVRSHGHSASHRNRSGIPMWAMFGGLAIAGLVIAAAGWALIGGDGDAGAVPVANANGASDGGVIDAVAGTATAVAGETSSSDPAGGASSGEPNVTQTAATNEDAGPPAGDATDASTLPPPIMPATEPNTTAPGSSTDGAVGEPAPSPIDTPNPTSPVNAPPVVQVPDGANAVRLAGSDGVEIANSDRLVDLRRPFTVELWTKLTPGSTRHWLAGNLVFLPPSPGDTEVVPAGWQWWLEETATGRWRISLTTRIGFFVDVNFDPARWHHLAVCGDGEQLYLFLDGELVGRKPAELLLGGWTESPLNLHLSAHARMLPQQRGGLNGDVRWARLSSTDRYTTNFVPETELASDAETLAL